MPVKVTSFETLGRGTQDFQWKDGWTASNYLKEANVVLEKGLTLSINGEQVAPETTVKDGDVLVVAQKIANG